jgi:type IV pilus assembly protein PilV
MQAAALKSNKEVRYQAVAGTFARELAEKMRGNHEIGIKTAAADNPYLINTLATTTAAAAPVVDENCFLSPCADGTIIAAWDIYDWRVRLDAALPTPKVVVCFDATPYTAAGVAQWACSNTGNTVVVKMSWTYSNTAGALVIAAAATEPLVVIPLTAGSSE